MAAHPPEPASQAQHSLIPSLPLPPQQELFKGPAGWLHARLHLGVSWCLICWADRYLVLPEMVRSGAHASLTATSKIQGDCIANQ